MADWKTGDVVQLKAAGSPIMTVVFVHPERGSCNCIWFVNDEEQRGSYPSEALREAPSGHIDQDQML